jgi:hypothetical protein
MSILSCPVLNKKESFMSNKCEKRGRQKIYARLWWEHLKKTDHLENLRLNWKTHIKNIIF